MQVFGNFVNNGTLTGNGTYAFMGAAAQRISGTGTQTFANLTINNTNADVDAGANILVRDTLRLANGHLALGDFNLTFGAPARIVGGSASSFVKTKNDPLTGGLCGSGLDATGARLFPVGTGTGYSPLTAPASSSYPVAVRVYDGMFDFGPGGPTPYPAADQFVQRTWQLSSGRSPNPFGATVTAHWATAHEGPRFNRAQCTSYLRSTAFLGFPWVMGQAQAVAAAGSNPYRATVTATSDCLLAVGNATLLSTRASTGPLLLNVFPNPTTGQVRLSNVAGSGRISLGLSSMLGQNLLPPSTGTVAELEAKLNAALADAAPGVYLITVQDGQLIQHLRLVRE